MKKTFVFALLAFALVFAALFTGASVQAQEYERSVVAFDFEGCTQSSDFMRSYEDGGYQESDTANATCIVVGPRTVTFSVSATETRVGINWGQLLRVPIGENGCSVGKYGITSQTVEESPYGYTLRTLTFPEGTSCLLLGSVTYGVLGEAY